MINIPVGFGNSYHVCLPIFLFVLFFTVYPEEFLPTYHSIKEGTEVTKVFLVSQRNDVVSYRSSLLIICSLCKWDVDCLIAGFNIVLLLTCRKTHRIYSSIVFIHKSNCVMIIMKIVASF